MCYSIFYMKKYIFIAIVIVTAAIIAALYMAPGAAKTSAADLPAPKAMGEILVKQIPVPVATSTAATTTVKKITPAKEIPAVKKTALAVTVKKTSTVKIASTGVRWASSGLSAIGSLSSFDYSTSIRNAYKRKVEDYAKSKGITLITASVVNSMHQ
jgi:hypothetical protein